MRAKKIQVIPKYHQMMQQEPTWKQKHELKAGSLPVAVTVMLALVLRCSSMNQITLAAGPLHHSGDL